MCLANFNADEWPPFVGIGAALVLTIEMSDDVMLFPSPSCFV